MEVVVRSDANIFTVVGMIVCGIVFIMIAGSFVSNMIRDGFDITGMIFSLFCIFIGCMMIFAALFGKDKNEMEIKVNSTMTVEQLVSEYDIVSYDKDRNVLIVKTKQYNAEDK